MYIEKLGLAFHLKCFRCSVCNQTLGNGKEGTDVRVSGQNRLHCNNCFSNDLGNNSMIMNTNIKPNSKSFLMNEELQAYEKNSLNELYNNLSTAGDYLTFKKYVQLKSKSKFFDDYLVLPNHLKSRPGSSNHLVKPKRH